MNQYEINDLFKQRAYLNIQIEEIEERIATETNEIVKEELSIQLLKLLDSLLEVQHEIYYQKQIDRKKALV